MNLRNIPEIAEMCEQIEKKQGVWDGSCKCTECYWNMWHPTIASGKYNNDESKICVSESLTEFEMTPNNSSLCKGYLNYAIFCGNSK